jgi:hypothetical protein
MQARIHRVAPLFADELIERELAARRSISMASPPDE